jgi:siroheme synthase
LDVSSPSEQNVQRNQHTSVLATNSHEPALAAPALIPNPLTLQDSSASMCVLSQDNDSKRVFERLYETGVVQVKKRQEEQEEKRIKENEVKLQIPARAVMR